MERDDTGAPATHRAGRKRRGRRLAVAVTVLAVVAGATAGALALNAHGERAGDKPAAAPTTGTAPVVRTDLSHGQSLTGTLGYGGRITVKGAGKGYVTRLTKTGSTVTRGRPLYWVDDRPVMVFFGDTPMFRELDKPGVSGRDVTVLAENLQALGYDTGPLRREAAPRVSTGNAGAEPGTELTPALTAALKRWQRDTGQKQTGTLGVGQVAVLPGPVKVGALKAQLGDPADGDVLTVTSVTKSVTVEVDARDAGPIHEGDTVSVALPDTRTVPGKVTDVGQTVAGGAGGAADEDPTGEQTPPTLLVTVVPTDGKDVKDLDAASVQVTFTTETRKDVLAVPVGALLALREGGYALQRPDGRLLGVKTGLFAKGMVEVSGGGLGEGDTVVTTS